MRLIFRDASCKGMGATGLRICERCRALENVGADRQRPCKICGFPASEDQRSARMRTSQPAPA